DQGSSLAQRDQGLRESLTLGCRKRLTAATVSAINGYSQRRICMNNTEQIQLPDQDLSVQSQSDQGIEGQVDNQEITPPSEESSSTKPIDYEKAYRNLEKEFTKRSQKLKQLEGWEKFQQETGITADQALQQLELYKQQFQVPPAPTGAQAQPYYNSPAPATSFDDPRISQLEQQIRELRGERQLQELR